jgi:hypothetical protein
MSDQEHMPEPSTNGPTEPNDLDVAITAFRHIMATEITTVLDALAAALQLAKRVAEAPPKPYYVVVTPDNEISVLHTVHSFDDFLAIFRTARKGLCQAFGFHDNAVYLPSKGGDYLVGPDKRYPLFTESFDDEVDQHGYFGAASVQQPAAAAVTTAGVTIDEAEEAPVDEESGTDEDFDEEEFDEEEPEDDG